MDAQEMARQLKEMTEKMEQEKQEKEKLQKNLNQATQNLDQATQKIDEATQKIDEVTQKIDEATQKMQKSNLLEFLDAVHVHLSRNIRVELNPQWTTKGEIPAPTRKLIPKYFRRWKDFDECQRIKWDQVVETGDEFTSARTFNSVHYYEELGPEICKSKIGSEKRLEQVDRMTLQVNVESLLQHLSKCDSKAHTLGLHGGIVFESHANTLSSDHDEVEERTRQLALTPKTPSRGSGPNAAPSKKHRTGTPDAYGVYRRDDQKQLPLIAVELKPPHKLPISMLLAGLRDMDPLEEVVFRATRPDKRDDPEGFFQYHADRIVAAAVTQTFSYMIENGLEYGYLGTGEAFVFLRVHEDDPGTVYYHLCVPNEEVGQETGWRNDSDDENRLHLTAVAQVSAFFLQAVEKKPRSQKWRDDARTILDTWHVETDDLLSEIPVTDRKELASRRKKPETPLYEPPKSKEEDINRSPYLFRRRPATCKEAENKPKGPADQDSSDGEDDSSDRQPPQPTPSKPPKQAAAKVADDKSKQAGQGRSYCTQRCLEGILAQAEFDEGCPNVLEHALEGTNGHHDLDSQEFLWLMQEQLFKDRDADCEPWWLQGARGAMFKVTLTSHGYTVAAKATIFAYVTDLKHEAAVYECMRKLQGTHVPVCLGGIDLLKPYHHRGVELVHMMFMAWGGESLYGCGQSLTDVRPDVADMAAECVKAMHVQGVLHRDVAIRNMLWNEERGRVMFVDFERSIVFETKQKQKQRQPLGEISRNRKRTMAVGFTDETCESHTQAEEEPAVNSERRVLLKNKFDKTKDYNHYDAFEYEVSGGRREVMRWIT